MVEARPSSGLDGDCQSIPVKRVPVECARGGTPMSNGNGWQVPACEKAIECQVGRMRP